jgi:hypothetical protein
LRPTHEARKVFILLGADARRIFWRSLKALRHLLELLTSEPKSCGPGEGDDQVRCCIAIVAKPFTSGRAEAKGVVDP